MAIKFTNPFSKQSDEALPQNIVPKGTLRQLKVEEIKPSANNPRLLFDPEPLKDLKENIKDRGVLVPITVYLPAGQTKYSILDGERRYKCCLELYEEGQTDIAIPANIVDPPDKVSGLLYMFSIHNFREPWELMPTAISLKSVMDDLGVKDNKKLASLTGLSETQVERCKWLLTYPEKFQEMSLNGDPSERIPSNFWIEAYPVLELFQKELPDYLQELGRDTLIQKLVDKYRNKKIKSVIHFRRIREAYAESHKDAEKKVLLLEKMKTFIAEENLETREAFDGFLQPRDVKTVITACASFKQTLDKMRIDLAVENKDELRVALKEVKAYVSDLLEKLRSEDPPNIDSQNSSIKDA